MPNIGVEFFKGRKWTPNIRISGINAPAEEFIPDPNLPVLGLDPRYPTADQIVIPRGRLLSVKPGVFAGGTGAGSSYGKAMLTIANGVSYKPMGYADTNILKQNPMREQLVPKLVKQEYIELPYVHTINNAYGQLNHGDRITAYYGTVGATNPNPEYTGRVVKWQPKATYCQTATASANVILESAAFGAFTPTLISACTSAGVLVAASGTNSLVWTDGVGWVANYATAVTQVIYTYGQEMDQIAGEVVYIEPIDATHETTGWLKWVTDNFSAFEWAPVAIRVPTTSTSTTSGYAAINSAGLMQLSKPIVFYKKISVYADATVIDTNGDTITYTSGGTAMPLADVPYANWTYGKYFTIDPYVGTLTFASNVTLTGTVKVEYEYETSYRDGRLWGAGQIGLTDGNLSGLTGVPAHLDAPNLLGSLRVIVN